MKVYQFMKVPSARFGEHRLFEQLGMPIEGLGDGFSWKSRDLEHSAELARAGWARAEATVRAGEHFMVVLDEIMYRCAMAGCRSSLCWPACASDRRTCMWSSPAATRRTS
nr:cob(I)alamin adenolsyltransferase/cobinamide ATP-dependent adenolsyltransferase [Methylibium sp. T29-B]